MATLGDTVLTLHDWASRIDPNGKVDAVAEMLNETNEILDDVMFMEGNLPTGHRVTVRSGLPTVAWRMLNYGVAKSKSRTVQVTDTIGMLEAYGEVDKDLADLNGNEASFRLSEDQPFIEAMGQEFSDTLFYGNTDTDPEKFLGLSIRYNAISGAENGENVIAGTGTGSDNTSVWLVSWGRNSIYGIFPKGSKAGLMHEDKGQVTLEDAAGGLYEGYRSHYQWKAGLTLKDWRYVVRICNIDVSALIADAGTVSAGDNLIKLMIRATHKLPKAGRGKLAFYCNETIFTYLDLQTLAQTNLNIKYGADEHGKEVMKFRGIPIRQCDSIINTEETYS